MKTILVKVKDSKNMLHYNIYDDSIEVGDFVLIECVNAQTTEIAEVVKVYSFIKDDYNSIIRRVSTNISELDTNGYSLFNLYPQNNKSYIIKTVDYDSMIEYSKLDMLNLILNSNFISSYLYLFYKSTIYKVNVSAVDSKLIINFDLIDNEYITFIRKNITETE